VPQWSAQAAASRKTGWQPVPPSGAALSQCMLLKRPSTICPHGAARACREVNHAHVFQGACEGAGGKATPPQDIPEGLPYLIMNGMSRRAIRRPREGFAWRLLLDSRVVDVPISYNPIVVTLSSLKPFFFNRFK
jgi:hypothetical protein